MTVYPTLLVAVAGAVGSLGTAIYLNRRRIGSLEMWAWGVERDDTDDGVSGQHRSLSGSIEAIDEKIDEQHSEVREDVRSNRRYFRVSLENLTDEVDDALPDVDLDVDDVEPDWAESDDQLYYGDGGRPIDDVERDD